MIEVIKKPITATETNTLEIEKFFIFMPHNLYNKIDFFISNDKKLKKGQAKGVTEEQLIEISGLKLR